jgi:hypothetical protein
MILVVKIEEKLAMQWYEAFTIFWLLVFASTGLCFILLLVFIAKLCLFCLDCKQPSVESKLYTNNNYLITKI